MIDIITQSLYQALYQHHSVGEVDNARKRYVVVLLR